MTKKYFLILLILTSCAQNAKDKEASIAQPQDAVEAQDVVDASQVVETTSFNKTNDTLKTKTTLLDKALQQLNIERSKVNTDLWVTKVMPNNPQETIMVIPEIIEANTDSYDFKFDSHIVIVNSKTGNITHNYFESAKTNGWVSDAVRLADIKIDTAPYVLAENTRAFGVRVYYYGSSQPNPNSNETLSLFVKLDDSLKKVLNHYEVMDYGGEWDTNCAGEFVRHTATLGMTANKTNGYFDIWVNTKVAETKNYEDDNGECESTDTVSNVKTTLKFNGKVYKEITHKN